MRFKKVQNISKLYIIQQRLGEGGFGTVSKAVHVKSQMECAVKVISKESLSTDRRKQLNRNEFEILEEISHPHITRVYELLEDSSHFYIVMELMRGGSLHDRLQDMNYDRTFDNDKISLVIY